MNIKMTTRNKGDKILIPTLQELKSAGWKWYQGGSTIYHPDFPVAAYRMSRAMHTYFGKTVTLIGIDVTVKGQHLYGIEEDNEDWRWCFDFFDEMITKSLNGCTGHEAGMTLIDKWIICKHCGTNLKEMR